jgi:Sulfotransferase domain
VFSQALLGKLAQGPVKPFMDGAVTRDFGDRIADRDFMVDYFRRRTAEIQAEVPPGRLLVFEAKQGWEPLCAFLGVPVPAEPYPRTNSREEMLERIAAAGSAPGDSPVTPEALMTMAKAYLEHQRRNVFASRI